MKTYTLKLNSGELKHLVNAMDELINTDHGTNLMDENEKYANAKHFRNLVKKVQELLDK